jgi:long-chain fatty acid transport protein
MAAASNGLNLIGFGTESTLMGGADVAVARDTSALNTNPAGLSRLRSPALDNYSAAAFALDVGHRDALDNDKGVSNHVIPLGGGGYARPLGARMTAGLGVFAQGGAGSVYKNVHTGFGNNDELSALFGILKFNVGASWKATDALALGVTASAIYSRIDQQIFPDTSVAGRMPFFGLQLKAVNGVNGTLKTGMLYTPSDRWTFGVTFAPKAPLDMDRGRAIVNMTAIGLGNVVYHDVALRGFALPTEAAVGAAFQATPSMLVSLKLDWLDWHDALRTSTLTLAHPERADAPVIIESSAAMNWHNQTVLAIGIAYDLNAQTTIWAGFNYGRNPVPAETTSPLLASIGERHFTLGARRRLDNGWELSGGIEYLPTASVEYTNPLQPLGIAAEERTRYIALHSMVSRRW